MNQHDYSQIPTSTLESLQRYVDEGCPLGGFLTAVVCGASLVEVSGRADEYNLAALPQIASWLYNKAPSTCHGSEARVSAWLAKHREARASA